MDIITLFNQSTPLFSALGDPQRQAIILALAHVKRASVNDLTEHVAISRPAVSYHMKMLRDVGLVRFEAVGRKRIYSLHLSQGVAQIKQLVAAIEQCEGYQIKNRSA
jgi:DNA-binding transcriptional ArsR family regulator